jgi:hypothetical protein
VNGDDGDDDDGNKYKQDNRNKNEWSISKLNDFNGDSNNQFERNRSGSDWPALCAPNSPSLQIQLLRLALESIDKPKINTFN